jgi:hypothetical protein
MKYATEGDLHNYLQKHFTTLTWNEKLIILWQITAGYLHLNVFIIFFKIK